MRQLIAPFRRIFERIADRARKRRAALEDLDQAIARNTKAHDTLRNSLIALMEARVQAPVDVGDPQHEDRNDTH